MIHAYPVRHVTEALYILPFFPDRHGFLLIYTLEIVTQMMVHIVLFAILHSNIKVRVIPGVTVLPTDSVNHQTGAATAKYSLT